MWWSSKTTSLECPVCEVSFELPRRWEAVYENGDVADYGSGRLYVPMTPAWCSTCNDFVWSEAIFPLRTYECILALKRMENEGGGSPWADVEYAMAKKRLELLVSQDTTGFDLDDESTQLEQLIQWRLQRRSPPRCLHCGSPEITQPLLSGEDVRHSLCGVRMKTEFRSATFSWDWGENVTAIYSTEGEHRGNYDGETKRVLDTEHPFAWAGKNVPERFSTVEQRRYGRNRDALSAAGVPSCLLDAIERGDRLDGFGRGRPDRVLAQLQSCPEVLPHAGDIYPLWGFNSAGYYGYRGTVSFSPADDAFIKHKVSDGVANFKVLGSYRQVAGSSLALSAESGVKRYELLNQAELLGMAEDLDAICEEVSSSTSWRATLPAKLA